MSQTIPTETSAPPARELEYRIATRIAAVAGMFSLIVVALLLYDHSRRQPGDPSEAAVYEALKLALTQQPNNEKVKEDIRALDRRLRSEYFRQRAFTAVGTGLLVGGIVVFLIAAKSAATLRRKLPAPAPQTTPQDLEARWTQVSRWSVAALAVVLLGAAVGLWLGFETDLPRSRQELAALLESEPTDAQPALSNGAQSELPQNGTQPAPPQNGTQSKPPAEPYAPPWEEDIRKMWPRFRGPGGLGISAYTNVPDSWDEKSGQGILWKEPVPLPGKNSPVVWEDRVFLSGADEHSRRVFCFHANTGKLLWQKDAPGTPVSTREPPRVSKDTGYAAPTTTADGRRVFAIFANGDLAAFDFDGNLAWARSLGIPDNGYGHASSLTMYRELLLVQFDQGSSGKKELSRLYALENASGKTVWEVRRKVASSWTSPMVISHEGRDQIITCSDPWVIAYNPKDGAEIWKAEVLSGECGPSAVFAGGLVHVGNEYCRWSAIRPDGEGDVTKTHVEWTSEEGLPDVCSPLATDQFVFLMPSTSWLTCLDAKTGEMLWEQEFEDPYFTSSPSLAGNRIYLFGEVESEDQEDQQGNPLKTCTTWILEPSREGCKIIGQSHLGEGCVTSPAFQDGRIYIRGEKHLFCIGEPFRIGKL